MCSECSFSGWTTLKPFSASDFFSTYINIVLVIILYFGWKFYKKTSIVKLHEMDVYVFFPSLAFLRLIFFFRTTHYVEGSVVRSKLHSL